MTGEEGVAAGPGEPAVAVSTVLVVGTGLVGTSVALALRAANVAVHLVDQDDRLARLAADLGAGTAALPTTEPQVVIVAVPPTAVAPVIARYAGLYLNTIFIDVASVATKPQQDVDALGAEIGRRYVGGHPMAGRERSGPTAAQADLFRDRPWVLTPTPQTPPRVLELARRVVSMCGADLVEMTPVRHDDAVALVSHLPQVMATLTASRLRARDDDLVALAAQGVRDVTRIAASDPRLWTEILDANAVALAELLLELQAELALVSDAVQTLAGEAKSTSRDVDESASRQDALAVLASVLEHGNQGRARIPGKHGGRPTEFAVVTVVVPDRPGELARIFVAAGEAGVNIEDVTLEHAAGHAVGTVALHVREGSVHPLAAALTDSGWSV